MSRMKLVWKFQNWQPFWMYTNFLGTIQDLGFYPRYTWSSWKPSLETPHERNSPPSSNDLSFLLVCLSPSIKIRVILKMMLFFIHCVIRRRSGVCVVSSARVKCTRCFQFWGWWCDCVVLFSIREIMTINKRP